MTAILTTDTHLTDRPQDEYRWGLLPWLVEQADRVKADELIHCGDLTEAKDRHPSRLVNRLIDNVSTLTQRFRRVILLKGNHDYIDPAHPFFGFLKNTAGITYVLTPLVEELSIGKATFIPAGVPWNFKLHELPYTFTHVTFRGSEAENGSLLPGIDPDVVADYPGRVYSGDIHVPQKVRKNIEYVGAPYHIRFGDHFTPRVLVLRDDGRTIELHYPAPAKRAVNLDSLKGLDRIVAEPGDHVRVRYYLRRTDYDTWHQTRQRIREYAEAKGWQLYGVEAIPKEVTKRLDGNNLSEYLTQEQMFEAYAEKHKLSDEYVTIGRRLLTGENEGNKRGE